MRLTRTLTGLVSAGLLGLTPVALSAPAEATETVPTVTTVSTYSTLPITVGDSITLSPDVNKATDGGSVSYGAVSLYVSTPSVPAWTLVATGTNTYSGVEVKPATNASYKFVYSGYTATSTYQDNYVASESAPFAVGVKRKAKFSTPGLFLKGKIKPDFKKKKVKLTRKKGKKYVAWKKVKTNKKGVFQVKAPNRRGFKFCATIPSDAKYTGFTSCYQVY